MNQAIFRTAVAALVLAMMSGCTATRLTTQAQLPPPLIEKLPMRVGIYFSKEFKEYVHRETRSNIEYEINLGPAHVTNIDWLMRAMFTEVVPVEDPSKIADSNPPFVFVLEPRFEEYSFLTPKDVAGEAFIVTIRYMLTLYDGGGARVDSFTLTGYGREKEHTLANKEPLAIATQRAMRDAGAKVAVELTEQESVRLLMRNAGSFTPLPPPPLNPPAGAAPGAEPPPRAAPTVEQKPAGESPVEAPPEPEPPPSGSGV
jgi:hypothetical protein